MTHLSFYDMYVHYSLLQAFGALGMARGNDNVDTASADFFFVKWRQVGIYIRCLNLKRLVCLISRWLGMIGQTLSAPLYTPVLALSSIPLSVPYHTICTLTMTHLSTTHRR